MSDDAQDSSEVYERLLHGEATSAEYVAAVRAETRERAGRCRRATPGERWQACAVLAEAEVEHLRAAMRDAYHAAMDNEDPATAAAILDAALHPPDARSTKDERSTTGRE